MKSVRSACNLGVYETKLDLVRGTILEFCQTPVQEKRNIINDINEAEFGTQ